MSFILSLGAELIIFALRPLKTRENRFCFLKKIALRIPKRGELEYACGQIRINLNFKNVTLYSFCSIL